MSIGVFVGLALRFLFDLYFYQQWVVTSLTQFYQVWAYLLAPVAQYNDENSSGTWGLMSIFPVELVKYEVVLLGYVIWTRD